MHLEITCLLDAKKYAAAQDLILSLYAPSLLIRDSSLSSTSALLSLLSKFPESEKSRLNWTCKGGLVHSYLELKSRFPSHEEGNFLSALDTKELESLSMRVSFVLDVLSDAGGGSQKLVQLWTTTGQGPRLSTPEIKSQVYICLCDIVEFFTTLSSTISPSKVIVNGLLLHLTIDLVCRLTLLGYH